MRVILVLATLFMMTIPACTSAPVNPGSSPSSPATDPTRTYQFPAKMGPMTTTWQASPGITLTDPLPTLTRAVFESAFIAETYTKADAFPGFVRLFGKNDYKLIDGGAQTYAGWTGTRRLLLQSITEHDGIVRATVCDDRAGLYRQKFVGKPQEVVMPKDRFRYGAGNRPYMDEPYTWFVELFSVDGEFHGSAAPAIGDGRSPNWDAFRGWDLVDLGWAESNQPGTPCDQWAHRNYPGLADPGPPPYRLYPNGFPDPDFQTTLPQSPGWTQVGQP